MSATVPTPTTDRELPNVVETARAVGEFGTFVAAVAAAGLEPTLATVGPVTVFVPSDVAFAQLPDGVVAALFDEPARLAQIINYHVVPGRVTAAEAREVARVPTINGEELPVSFSGYLQVDGARLISADIEASNGVLHVIDRLLLPAMM